MVIVLPVERWVPIGRCLGAKALNAYGDHGWVVLCAPVRRLLRQRIDVLDHIHAGTNVSYQSGLLAQFPFCCLNRRLTGLDATGDHMPVTALFRYSVDDQNLSPSTPSDEDSYLSACAHSVKVRAHRHVRWR
jgi:hypothetical protein